METEVGNIYDFFVNFLFQAAVAAVLQPDVLQFAKIIKP